MLLLTMKLKQNTLLSEMKVPEDDGKPIWGIFGA